MLSSGTTVSRSPRPAAALGGDNGSAKPAAEARSSAAWVRGRTVETEAVDRPATERSASAGPVVNERWIETRVDGGKGTSAALAVRVTVRIDWTEGVAFEGRREVRVVRGARLRASSRPTSGLGVPWNVLTVCTDGGGGRAC